MKRVCVILAACASYGRVDGANVDITGPTARVRFLDRADGEYTVLEGSEEPSKIARVSPLNTPMPPPGHVEAAAAAGAASADAGDASYYWQMRRSPARPC